VSELSDWILLPGLLPLGHKVDVPAVDGVVEVGARKQEDLLLERGRHPRVELRKQEEEEEEKAFLQQ
jgi:hypothetical protein